MNPPGFAVVGAITWLAIFEHNYDPRIYRYGQEVTILEVGDSEPEFDRPPGAPDPTKWTTLYESPTSREPW